MSQARFHFYAELNHFLSPARRDLQFAYSFEGRPAIKDLIEALGVPHTEVELLVVNGAAVNLSYILQDGDVVEVYPSSHVSAMPAMPRVRPQPERYSFVLDAHLGKLAAYLRMLGFDTLYRNDYHDEELAWISNHEQRILLTRDLGLLKRSMVTHGYFMRETDPRKQVVEVLRRYELFSQLRPLERCLRCNGLLTPIDKSAVLARIPQKTSEFYDEFHMCADCQQIYWQGPHYQRILDFIQQVLQQGGLEQAS